MSKNALWTHFWEQGFPTSFASQLPNNYTGKVEKFWRDHFSKLKQAKILDIATGNGAIALLAAKTDSEKANQLEIVAVDYANINPSAKSNNEALRDLSREIKFIPSTPIEALPFSEQSFDLVTSQFGFEYADPEKGSKEIARILARSGKFIAICHFENSRIHNYCVEDFNAYRKVIFDLKLDQKIAHLFDTSCNIEPVEQAPSALSTNPTSNIIENIKTDLNELRHLFPKATVTLYLNGALNYFLKNYIKNPKGKKSNLAPNIARELHTAYGRIEHQLNATLSSQDINTYIDLFASLGLQKKKSEIFHDDSGEALGWVFEFIKPAK